LCGFDEAEKLGTTKNPKTKSMRTLLKANVDAPFVNHLDLVDMRPRHSIVWLSGAACLLACSGMGLGAGFTHFVVCGFEKVWKSERRRTRFAFARGSQFVHRFDS
jgi:hypothetical protein